MNKVLISILTFLMFLSFTNSIYASPQLSDFEGKGEKIIEKLEQKNLPLTSEQMESIKYEELFQDIITEKIVKVFGSEKAFEKKASFYLSNKKDEDFKFVFTFSKNDKETKHLLKEVKKEVPSKLIKIKKSKHSKSYLDNIETKLFNSIEKIKSNSTGGVSISTNLKVNKVKISVDTVDEKYKEKLKNKYNDSVYFETNRGVSAEKDRKDTFDVLGGGLAIENPQTGGECTTAGTAVSGSYEYLITAGHCIGDIDNPVEQFYADVGVYHWSNFNYGGSGSDLGLIRLTDTDRQISNHYYYSDYANTEYGENERLGYTDTPSSVQEGEVICKSGKTTGNTCGTIMDVDSNVVYEKSNYTATDVIEIDKNTTVRYSNEGDSGAVTYDPYTEAFIGVHVAGGFAEAVPDSNGFATKVEKLNELFANFQIYVSDEYRNVNPNY